MNADAEDCSLVARFLAIEALEIANNRNVMNTAAEARSLVARFLAIEVLEIANNLARLSKSPTKMRTFSTQHA